MGLGAGAQKICVPATSVARPHDLARSDSVELAGVEVDARELAGWVPPPRRGYAGTVRLLQAEELTEEVVGPRAR